MVSELERKRLENIKHNEQLLKELELESLGKGIVADTKKPSPPKKPAAPKRSKPKVIKEEVPRRRSRRLEGLGSEFDVDDDKQHREWEIKREKEERDRDRVEGEKKLKDVIQRGDWNTATNILSDIGNKVSQGDYFEMTKMPAGKDAKKAREELSSLEMDTRFDNTGLKLVTERIFTTFVHPDPAKRLVMAGDKMGQLGVWDADQAQGEDDDEPCTYAFKVHSRAISKILPAPSSPEKIYMSSYDGSIRCLDFKSEECVEAYVHDSDPRNPVGISDLSIPEPNLLYFATLDGQVGYHDLRTPVSEAQIFRAHDKKIGGFSVNPQAPHQLATGSLDRTMKLWDIRNFSKSDDDELVPHCYGEYASRLSVSCTDWNRSGHVVINGYADKLQVFDMSQAKDWGKKHEQGDLSPEVTLKHNCQTGRWVSILKARWQSHPTDLEKFTIANMNRFIDIFAADGQQLAHLGCPEMTAVPAAVCMHPTQNWVVGGSASGRVYLWS